MKEAIALSKAGMENNDSGPFGCVIVKGDEIIGRGNNKVLCNNDPTAHAEITAIRDACKNLSSFQLEGCEIYSSCEPCPICLGAIYWARPAIIYYANTREDAAKINFDDSMIYEEMKTDIADRKIPMISLSREKALEIFRQWPSKANKNAY